MKYKTNPRKAFLLSFIFAFLITNSVYAAENATQSASETRGYSENYMLIIDEITGEQERIELGPSKIETEIIDGQSVLKSTLEMDGNQISEQQSMTRASQSNSNTINGWYGRVEIYYMDDGTYACLRNVNGSWTATAGAASMTKKNVHWGQVLGTNSKSGNSSFTTYANVITYFTPGKYGSGRGHFLRANISGSVNGKTIYVTSNYYF